MTPEEAYRTALVLRACAEGRLVAEDAHDDVNDSLGWLVNEGYLHCRYGVHYPTDRAKASVSLLVDGERKSLFS